MDSATTQATRIASSSLLMALEVARQLHINLKTGLLRKPTPIQCWQLPEELCKGSGVAFRVISDAFIPEGREETDGAKVRFSTSCFGSEEPLMALSLALADVAFHTPILHLQSIFIKFGPFF